MSIGSKQRRDRKRRRDSARATSRRGSSLSGTRLLHENVPPHQEKALKSVTTARAENNVSLAKRLEGLVTDLEARGGSVNRSSRIFQYIRDLKRFEARSTPLQDPKEIERFVAARMDGGLLADTFEALKKSPEVPGWRSPHFDLALKGGPLAGGEDDRPRAKILELYVAAVAKNAGYGVELEEPDVVLTVGSAKYGCAAKRPRSIRKLQERIEEGVEQIARQSLDGFIIVDLTLLLDLHEGLYTVENPDEYTKVCDSLLTRVAELSSGGEVDRWIRNHRSGHRIFGVGAVAFATVYVRSTRKVMNVRRWVCDGVRTASNDPQVAFFYEFTGRLR